MATFIHPRNHLQRSVLQRVLRAGACVAGLLVAGSALAQGCRSTFTCPDGPGHVVADDSFEFQGDARWLDAWEIQCAIDCLDGDRFPEHSPDPVTGAIEVIEGGVVEFVPLRANTEFDICYDENGASISCTPVTAGTYRHRFQRAASLVVGSTVKLPMAAKGSVILRGNGAVARWCWTWNAGSQWCSANVPGIVGTQAFFERVAPPGANACDVAWMKAHCMNWVIEGFRFQGSQPEPPANEATHLVQKAIRMHGSIGFTIRDCRIGGFGVGVDLHDAEATRLENNVMSGAWYSDVLVADKGSCDLPYPGRDGDCWAPCSSGESAVFPDPPSWVQPPGGPATRIGSVGTTIRGSNVSANIAHDATFRVRNTDGVVVDRSYLDGWWWNKPLLKSDDTRPPTILPDFTVIPPQPRGLAMRDTFAYLQDDSHSPYPVNAAIVHDAAAGLLTVSGLSLEGLDQPILYEAAEGVDTRAVISHLHGLYGCAVSDCDGPCTDPIGNYFRVPSRDGFSHRVTFRDLGDTTRPTLPSLWLPPDGVPPSLSVTSFDLWQPPASDRNATPLPGAISLDSSLPPELRFVGIDGNATPRSFELRPFP